MNKIFDNKQEFTELYRDAVMSISGKSVEAASDLDRFNALAKLVAEKARTVATKSDARATAEGKKRPPFPLYLSVGCSSSARKPT